METAAPSRHRTASVEFPEDDGRPLAVQHRKTHVLSPGGRLKGTARYAKQLEDPAVGP